MSINKTSSVILILLVIVSGCRKHDQSIPLCTIISPANNSKVIHGHSISINSIVKSNASFIQSVEFIVDDSILETSLASPYNFLFKTVNHSIGNHEIRIIARDNMGLTSEDKITIIIVEYTPPTPIVDSRDGNYYQVKEIGDQVWMSENLKFKTELALFVNNNDSYTNEYGYLYQTNTAMGADICPDEWHIPAPDDWNKLFEHLGGIDISGGKLKKSGYKYWLSPNTGATNESGFSALAAGSLTNDSIADAFGSSARFFTSTYGTYIHLNHDSNKAEIIHYHPLNEYYSIRCLRNY